MTERGNDRRGSGGQRDSGSSGAGRGRGAGKSGAGRSGGPGAGKAGRPDAGSGGRPGSSGRTGGSGAGRPGAQGAGKPTGSKSRSRSGAPRGKAANAGQPGSHPNRPAVQRPNRSSEPARDVHVADGVRLQKVLAAAGFGSRRACEVLIEEGRVEVDGQIVMELGVRVDPASNTIHVDGLRLQLDTNKITILFNKPLGVVSTMEDPEGRPSLGDYFKNREERLFHVGRLDADSEGLLLLTNDGELANRLSHPKYEVTKTYFVEVEGKVLPSLVQTLLAGVKLDDGLARVDSARIIDTTPRMSLVEVVLHEGRNRIVRRIFDSVGHPVTRLVRTKIGKVPLGDLPPGRQRVLGRVELGTLMSEVGL